MFLGLFEFDSIFRSFFEEKEESVGENRLEEEVA